MELNLLKVLHSLKRAHEFLLMTFNKHCTHFVPLVTLPLKKNGTNIEIAL